MQSVGFWNGNKTAARQAYELALLDACLAATQEQGLYKVVADNTDYPLAEEEGNIFASGCDVLVTVAGNVKFKDKQKIVIKQPLAKGLLGYRLLTVRNDSLTEFQALTELEALQALSIGIPATWADAELFRHNKFKVVERGSLDDIFIRLQDKEFVFLALGANEIEGIFAQNGEPLKGLSIEPSMLIHYPFPLVFYVHPDKPELALRIEKGLLALFENGRFDSLFFAHHGDVVQRLNLRKRKIFSLDNPLLPADMRHFPETLLA